MLGFSPIASSPIGALAQAAGGVTEVVITPASIRLNESESQHFSAAVLGNGSPSQAVTWQASLGTIDSSGKWIAPLAGAVDRVVTITATSVADPSKSGAAFALVNAKLFDSWGFPMEPGEQRPVILPVARAITEEEAESGEYAKDRYSLYGLTISIETARGAVRSWKAADGTKGSHVLDHAYGYIEGTLGNDGDELDCTLGPAPLNAELAYVVNQHIDGQFDEHKIMFGFASAAEAEAGYLSGYSPDWLGLGSCVPCSITQLKWWINNGDKSKPLSADMLPIEGTNEMEKVLWDSANMPLHANLEQVLYRLRAHDGDDGLLFDSVTMADIMGDADGVPMMDALVVPFARLEPRMQLMRKTLDRASKGVKVAAMQVSDPFTQRGTTNVAVIYELTDGQTISVFFHNPDVTPKKIAPGDDVVSWKWMLNKKDITVAVAPERGRDLDVRTVAARIMLLAGKNSERFGKANETRAAKLQVISELQTELQTKEATLAALEKQIADITAEREIEGLDDPDGILPSDADLLPPNPEPEPGPAPAALDVDSMKAVVAFADPMAGVEHGADWVVMNAPRPLLGTETMSNGEFLSGRYYAAIDPTDSMALAYVAENKKLDASVVFVADQATQVAMALQTVNPRYLRAYMDMPEDERVAAISGFITKLNGRSYGELKELAAKGMPSAPEPTADDEARAQEEAARAAAEAEQAAQAAAAAEAERLEAEAQKAREDQESADGNFLALAAAGDVDFFDKTVTDRLAELAKKYTDPEGAFLDLVMQAKTAAKNFFINEFKKKVA